MLGLMIIVNIPCCISGSTTAACVDPGWPGVGISGAPPMLEKPEPSRSPNASGEAAPTGTEEEPDRTEQQHASHASCSVKQLPLPQHIL